MSRVFLTLALAALVPVAARAEPISVELSSASSGFSAEGDISLEGRDIDLGTLSMDAGSEGTFYFSDATPWRNYTVSFDLEGTGMNTLRVEVLDPLGDGDDALDPADQPSYLPDGYSTSNDRDGFSFAQNSGVERAATFAGGSASVTADEHTHRGDILLFAGLDGVEHAMVMFGLRDTQGGRGFLLRLSADGDPVATPEPASMLLIGSGLAGLAAARRRRRGAASVAP